MFRTLSAALVIVGLVIGGSATALACGGQKNMEAKKYDTVDATTLASWIDKNATKVFHAASEETYAAGTVPTAVRVDYKAMTAATLGDKKDARMTFMCANTMCSASSKAAMAAVEMGYTDVHVFKEGIAGWAASGKELVKAKVKADG